MSSYSAAPHESNISAVIPVYNEEHILGECLDALSRQTMRPHVVYIIDNNSTDRTVAIAQRYSFVEVLSEQTQGICAATKKGLDTAAKNGGIILRLDADSRPVADWIERMATFLRHHESFVAITGPGVAYDEPALSKIFFSLFYMKPYFLFVGIALGQQPLFGSNFGIRAASWASISHKTHLSSHQNIHDDIDISYHLSEQGRIKYEHTIKMPISARPMHAPLSSLVSRYGAGFRSVFIHWPQQAPWNNWSK